MKPEKQNWHEQANELESIMDKLNYTELVSGANNRSRSSVKIYSKVLPGLFMLVLGVITLSLPVVANAQYEMRPADYYRVLFGSNAVILQRSPKIFAQSGLSYQYVGFFPELWRKDANEIWRPMQTNAMKTSAWRWGIALANKPWEGTDTWFQLQQLGAGTYRVSAYMYRHNGTRWVPIGNIWVSDYWNYFQTCGSTITFFNSDKTFTIPGTCSPNFYGRHYEVLYSGY